MIWRIILLLLLCSSIRAQVFNAAQFEGIGNTGLALKSIYSITNNASGLADLNSAEAAVAYQANFVSTELSHQAVYFGVPFQTNNAFGVSLHRYGLSNISSFVTFSGVYVRSFGEYLSSSLSANYHSFSVQNYGSEKMFSVDLGFQFQLLEQLNLGAIFRNISNQMFQEDIDYYLPREAGVGFQYIVSEDIFLSVDSYYDPIRKLNFRAGVSYGIDGLIYFRAGASNAPVEYFAGIGVNINRIKLDCSSSFHTQLGSSPQIALAYAF